MSDATSHAHPMSPAAVRQAERLHNFAGIDRRTLEAMSQADLDRLREEMLQLPVDVEHLRELHTLLVARLRRDNCRSLAQSLVDAIDGKAQLSHRERAQLDRLIYGVGYLMNGERIDPRLVRTIDAPRPSGHDTLEDT